ncbi:uncharacterized protein I206_104905 [Kwoniella pini CBS 10737]|uniref:Uncharacterized protein n=1 Tax=Kwoniella pini CBS 10737 TaxID=1296096 RepID=A0A1B9I846_9TREE|nr:uncharacterized protein I206_02445 [Kwoniella pini CBS 10737]OCF51730.1 hypothetical protein I206_02445 [Kwoniella pini CBS 10737]
MCFRLSRVLSSSIRTRHCSPLLWHEQHTNIPARRSIKAIAAFRTICSPPTLRKTQDSTPEGQLNAINPHRDSRQLLDDTSIPLRSLLDHYDLSIPIPKDQLPDLLSHHSTATDILALMPSVIAYMEDSKINIDDAVSLIQKLLAHLGKHQMYALLHPVVQLFTQRIEREITVYGPTMKIHDMLGRYKGFIQFLRFFSSKPSGLQHPLPLPVRREVFILVSHLIDMLESFPSSSDYRSQPHLSDQFLYYIFRRRFLTPELRKLLLKHTYRHDIELTPFQWQQCTFSAMDEEDTQSAEKYRLKWREMLNKKRQEGETGYFENTKESIPFSPEITVDSSVERGKLITSLIKDMVISRWNQSIKEIVRILGPHLTPIRRNAHLEVPNRLSPSLVKREQEFERANFDSRTLLQFSWSILLDRCSKDEKITTEALLEMAETLPGEAIIGHTLTPIMYGLIKRGEPLKAWEIWRDLIEREKTSSNSSKGLFVDRVTLAVATEACHAASNLDASVVLVDTWAKKTIPIEEEDDEWAGSIKLDNHNVNILLNLCRLGENPSIAFRLWEAALPRYGVFMDDISLNLLLDLARYSNEEPEDGALSNSQQSEMFRQRLRAIADEFSFRRRRKRSIENFSDNSELMEENSIDGVVREDYWAKGPTSILLDDLPNDVPERPWQKARSIFRQVVLGNWPFLKDVQSPLELAHQGMFDSIVSFFCSSSNEILDPTKQESKFKDTRNRIKIIESEIQLPDLNAKYTHIIPTSNTFKSYIALLGYYNLYSEIPTVLAWMKKLNIKPNWSTMCLALLHICENEGPRRWIKGFGKDGESDLVRDEEIIRSWLIDWLGSGDEWDNQKGKKRKIVPTEQDIAKSRRWLAERRRRMNA